MTVQDKIAHGFGRILAETPGTSTLDERLETQKAAFLDVVMQGGRKPGVIRRIRPVGWVAAAAVAAVCLPAVIVLSMYTNQISFYSGSSSEALPEGHFIRTASSESETIRFDGGHRFEFAAETKARVVKSGAGQVIVDVEKGAVSASVVPGSGVAWTVRAGPYEVVVKGTVFSVDWNESSAVLSVAVSRGKVAVRGPGMDGEGVFVSAGKSLRADSNRGRVTLGEREKSLASSIDSFESTAAPADDVPHDIAQPELEIETEPAGWPDNDVRSSNVHRKVAATLDWKAMYAARDFQGIMELAEKKGIDNLKRRLDKDALWIVANSARYSRNRQTADDLFSTFRNRFPESAQSQTAAFLLAKSAWERGNYSAAKQWFEMYSHEAPDGPLAEEALGRLIQIYQKLGNRISAVRAAQSYLAKYEGGYFTKQARAVVKN